MHIVLVCREYIGSSRAGGIASYLQEISAAYNRMGHRVTIVTASEDTSRRSVEKVNDSFKIIRVEGGDFINPSIERQSVIRRFRFLYRFNSYRRKLREVINEIQDVDIIEVADYGAEGLYLENLGIPVVLRLHTPLTLDIPTLSVSNPSRLNLPKYISVRAEKTIFSKAKYISSCSNALLMWVDNNLNVSPKLTDVVNNPIDTSKIKDVSCSKKDNTIFYGGTICETKGVADLVSACKAIRDRGIDIKLKLAGKGGRYYNSLKEDAEKHKWDWMIFLGKLNRSEMFDHYRSSTICCFPSWWENMPMVCLEAMAVGAVVIASSSGGAKEIITHGKNGFIVDRKNPDMLADCITTILSMDKEKQKLIGQEAKRHIQNNFNTELIAKKMLAFYQDVAEDFNNIKK